MFYVLLGNLFVINYLMNVSFKVKIIHLCWSHKTAMYEFTRIQFNSSTEYIFSSKKNVP